MKLNKSGRQKLGPVSKCSMQSYSMLTQRNTFDSPGLHFPPGGPKFLLPRHPAVEKYNRVGCTWAIQAKNWRWRRFSAYQHLKISSQMFIFLLLL